MSSSREEATSPLQSMSNFEILHEDSDIVVINKPSGILVHRTAISNDRIFVVQELRNQLGKEIFPVHRLDRPTSGCLVFALNSETASGLCDFFRYNAIQKEYVAITRGFLSDQIVDSPLWNEDKTESLEAHTEFQCLEQWELNIASGKYPTSRISKVRAIPKTGRMHQIRRHLARINHPIIIDRRYGDNKLNRELKKYPEFQRLMLHAASIQFKHPQSGEHISVEAPLPEEWIQAEAFIQKHLVD